MSNLSSEKWFVVLYTIRRNMAHLGTGKGELDHR
jgi:hypothetical protein